MHIDATLESSATSASPLCVSLNSDEPEGVAEVFRAVLQELPYYNERAKAGELEKYTPAKLREAALADSDAVLVARARGHLAGFLFNHCDDETVWLSWFGVLPELRKNGVGSALLRALDDRAKRVAANAP